MKISFYCLTHYHTPREWRTNHYEYFTTNWQKYCGTAVRPGDLLTYWFTRNEFYLNFESALTVQVDLPDSDIKNIPNRYDWNIFSLSDADFYKLQKESLVLHELRQALYIKCIRDKKCNNETWEEMCTLDFYKELKQKKDMAMALSGYLLAYRSMIANEEVAKLIGREHPTKINTMGKLDHIWLYCNPTFIEFLN